MTLSDDAPEVIPLGTTTVTWTATDPAGHTTSAAQAVTVVDTTAPVLTCPGDLDLAYTLTVVPLGAGGRLLSRAQRRRPGTGRGSRTAPRPTQGDARRRSSGGGRPHR